MTRYILSFLLLVVMTLTASAQITIGVRNHSKVPDSLCLKAVRAIDKQVKRDFYPVWGITADVILLSPHDPTPPGVWPIRLVDSMLERRSAGIHNVLNGTPSAYVDMKQPYWENTLSHETLEMLVNPYCNKMALVAEDGDWVVELWRYEVADPVQAPEDGYFIDGVLVSNFVYPVWFEKKRPGVTRYDFVGVLDGPLQIQPDGYAVRYQMYIKDMFVD